MQKTQEIEFIDQESEDSLLEKRIVQSVIFAIKANALLFVGLGLFGLINGDGPRIAYILFSGCFYDCMLDTPFIPLGISFVALFIFGFIFYNKKLFLALNYNDKRTTFIFGIIFIVILGLIFGDF